MITESTIQLAVARMKACVSEVEALLQPPPALQRKKPPAPLPTLAGLTDLVKIVRDAYAERERATGGRLTAPERLEVALATLTNEQRFRISRALMIDGTTPEDVRQCGKLFGITNMANLFSLARPGRVAMRKITKADVPEICRRGRDDQYITALRMGLTQGNVHFTLNKHEATP